MPVLNGIFRDAGGAPSPVGLAQVGAVFVVEVQVPSQVAKLLTDAGKPVPQGVQGLALLDTGASITGVDQAIISQLGVPPVGRIKTGTAAGPADQNTYPARLIFLNVPNLILDAQQALGVNLAGQTVTLGAGQPAQPLIALIGRDALANWVLNWNGPAAIWTVSY